MKTKLWKIIARVFDTILILMLILIVYHTLGIIHAWFHVWISS